MNPEAIFYSSEGSRLFFTTIGAGPDLVLLHPTPLDHTFWLPVAADLSGRYRLTIPDLRGHGQSQSGQADTISIEQLGEDVARLLDAAEIQHALFAGCSIGGYVLYDLWRRIPHRIDALALCCGKPQPDSDAGRAKRRQNIEKIRSEGVTGFFDQTMETLVPAAFRKREPGKSAELRAMMNAMGPEAVIAVQQGLMDRPSSLPTLETLTVPVLALAASEDPASTPEEMKAIPEFVPTAEYHLLPGAGHYAPYERPRTAGRLLGAFFDRVPPLMRSGSCRVLGKSREGG